MATTTTRRKTASPRVRVRKASTEIAAVPTTQMLRERWDRLMDYPKGELAVGAGLLGVLTVLAIPPRGWAMVGGSLFGAAAWIVRAPIGAVVIGAILAKRWSDEQERPVIEHESNTDD